MQLVIWHGTAEEAYALGVAINHNCACAAGKRCGAHAAMLDQRFIDGLCFGRFLRPRLEAEEFEVKRCTSPRLVRTRSRSGG